MIKLVLQEITEAIRGQTVGPPPSVSVNSVSTDSRSVGPGQLFFALPGEHFDGHDFVPAALQRGAVAAVVGADRVPALMERGVNSAALVSVDDPLAALARLAVYHRRMHPATVIAVAGSNGKTTTKAMVDHLLSARLRGRASPKSFNNNVGVPLTLLSAEGADDYLVVEIGTNAPGEVDELAALATPDIAILTCIGEEHLAGLGDLEGVANEECSIFKHLSDSGAAIVNIDSPQIRSRLANLPRRRVTFGEAADADLRLTRVQYESPWLHFELNGRFAYRLHMPGVHNASNAASAIAAARRLGFEHAELADRLESFVPPPMRSEVLRIGGVTIVNDAYNANPHSALAAIATLEAVAGGGRRVVVFGEMRELGEQSAELHRRVAERLKEQRVDHVILVGAACEYMHDTLRDGGLFCPTAECCDTVAACAERLCSIVRTGDVVLLKGSRAVGLERILDVLRSKAADAAAVAV